MIPDCSDSFLQMQDPCVLHTDVREISLDILLNSKGRDAEARAEELVSSVMLFCKIGIAKQKTIRQPNMIHVIQFPYWMGSDQRLRYTEMILAQVWNKQICPFKASKPVIFVLDGANNLHLGS